jgi:hypothetical protein
MIIKVPVTALVLLWVLTENTGKYWQYCAHCDSVTVVEQGIHCVWQMLHAVQLSFVVMSC